MPAVKNIIENVFRKPPLTSLNQDEAVSRGAALQCAIMSPTMKVKSFTVNDLQPYGIQLSWSSEVPQDP